MLTIDVNVCDKWKVRQFCRDYGLSIEHCAVPEGTMRTLRRFTFSNHPSFSDDQIADYWAEYVPPKQPIYENIF